MRKIAKATAVFLAAALALTVAACSPPTPAASEFVGTWAVSDSAGAPFEIVLAEDGSASADRSGEQLSGTWVEDNGNAVISWSEGWTTKIAKDGDGYKKMAWDKGVSTDSPPTNTSAAAKAN